MINESCQVQLPNIYNYSFKSNIDDKMLIFIYQITCKDPNINENYIGQTECFEKRKYSHSRDSQTSGLKIYKTIREYGGWDNWQMKIINHYYCNNEYEARQIEQKYIDIFKATMNSVRAYSKSFINEELDRQLEFEINDFSNKILGCYLYDYYLDFDPQIECEYCNKIFSNNSNLKTHIKNSKYCLKLRNVQFEGNFTCSLCKKSFSTKQYKENHEKICNNNSIINENILLKQMLKEKEEMIKVLKEQIKEKDEVIKDLKKEFKKELKEKDDCIERLATVAINRPTTHNQRINNIINNLTPITENYLNEQAEHLTLDHIKNGVNGYVQYALDYPLKDKIVCTDFSRKRIKYKDEAGNLIDDPEMVKLAQKLFKAIEDKNTTLINEYIHELFENYNELAMGPNEDEDKLRSKIKLLTKKLLEVKKQQKNVIDIAKGDKNETYYDFMKYI